MARSGKIKIYDRPARKSVSPLLLILLVVLLVLAGIVYRMLRH